MTTTRIGCITAAILILLIVGAIVFRSPDLPSAAAQEIDRLVREREPAGFVYHISSAEKAARTIGGNTQNVEFIPGGVNWPAGILAPNGPMARDNWCVILDKPINARTGIKTTHLIVQQQDNKWVAQGVADSEAVLFRHFGCSRW